MAHEETRRSYCSLATEVFLLNLGDANMDPLPYLPLVSVLENTGACPSCGNPICRPKVMEPPFPPHPQSLTVSEPNTHVHMPTCTRVHTLKREQAVLLYCEPDSGSVCALEHI